MDRDVVIWDELVHREVLSESMQICQHKITKLFSVGNHNAPSCSNLGHCNKITEVLEEFVLMAIGGQRAS